MIKAHCKIVGCKICFFLLGCMCLLEASDFFLNSYLSSRFKSYKLGVKGSLWNE